MLALGLLILGTFARVVVHVPNFTPVLAMALFGGVYLKKNQALLMPLVLLALTDLILGVHQTMFFTWGSVFLISAMGLWLKTRKSPLTVFMSGVLSTVLFFVVTNFGVWLVSGMYDRTWAGLVECFVLAVPFYKSTLLGTFVYGAILFGTYELVAARVKDTKFGHVL